MSRRVLLVCLLMAAAAACGGESPSPDLPPDPYPDPYGSQPPDLIQLLKQGAGYGGAFQNWIPEGEAMKLSSEPSFFTLNLVDEDDRAYALIEAGRKKEGEGQWRDAIKIYQELYERLLNKNPDILYRISKYGIFVPAAQYVQRRILRFPKEHLAFYRTMYDARARESFEQARRQYSLIGLSEIVDSMLATSYGDNALMELGNAALDTGHYLEAQEYFGTIRDFFPDSDCLTPELDLKIAYCSKMLGMKGTPSGVGGSQSKLSPDQLAQLKHVLDTAHEAKPEFHSQLASAPYIAADDYTLFPPTKDLLGLAEPTWTKKLSGAFHDHTRGGSDSGWPDHFVFSQPVVTKDSIIYRAKNILYSRSILNGELRWMNDLGGRAVWQNRRERMYPLEDCVVQDGLVFAPVFKGGPSMVAFDEVTGQMKWAFGPMVASTPEEARMRFESAPAGGPRTIYAGYVQDNIEGETHTDTEYGLIAFDSASGRVRWKKSLCRMTPGKFSGGFAEHRRNRIRSFSAAPLYAQGTVYYNTNAGVIVALDARSGRIKWLMKYPYWPGVHDATRQFGAEISTSHWYKHPVRPHSPMFWFGQRPLLVGERLFVAPVDSRVLFSLDRRSGQIQWTRPRVPEGQQYAMDPGVGWVLGPTRAGQLVLAFSGWAQPVQLVDPETGKTVWASGGVIVPNKSPTMSLGGNLLPYPYAMPGVNGRWYSLTSRPFLTTDDVLYLTHTAHIDTGYSGAGVQAFSYQITALSLTEKKFLGRRVYYTPNLQVYAEQVIRSLCPVALKALEDLPHKDDQTKKWIEDCKKVIADDVPTNEYGPFLPFSRLTFTRYGIPFEMRFGTKDLAMLYDRDAAQRMLAARQDPESIFARAELAIADSRYQEASDLLIQCLGAISSEDLDFRSAINQQLYRVHQHLARSGIRAGDTGRELTNALGMSRTANTLAEEVETLFALSEAYERKGELENAARCLRSIIGTYGQYEYPIPALNNAQPEKILATATEVIRHAETLAKGTLYGNEFSRAFNLLQKGLPLYLSTVSPLPKTLTVRAGELAAARLARLQSLKPEFRKSFEGTAAQSLKGRPPEEQLHRLWEFPATQSAQEILDALFRETGHGGDYAAQKRLWHLADAARICGLKIPAAFAARVGAPPPPAAAVPLAVPVQTKEYALDSAEGTTWLVMDRLGDPKIEPDLLFIAGRVKKRLDNKFIVQCRNLKSGETAWETADIRLRGTGQEPGFFKAYVFEDSVVVHGLYDVLSLNLKDGKERWHFRAPFDFEIKESVQSGDLLVLSDKVESMALYLGSKNPDGDVAWQVEEQGDLYIPPYTVDDRIVFVRKLPYSVTVRYRATGKLIGRLALPDLSMHQDHPLIEGGPEDLPAAHEGDLLLVTDGFYYIAVDTHHLVTLWKRLIDQNDMTREPAMRMALGGDFLAVTKENYDQKVIYMLSSKTGTVLWNTDPKDANSPQPLHSVHVQDDKAYGIGVHPGQGFYFMAYDAQTGKRMFRTEVKDFQAKPKVELLPRIFGTYMVAQVQDAQDYQLRVFEIEKGALVHNLQMKGAGSFGQHGRVSATVQNGHLSLLSKDKIQY